MSNFLSHKHAVNTIRLMYKNRGFDISKLNLGSQVEKELNIEIKDAPFAALYAYVDEYIALLRCQSAYFLSANHEKNPMAIIFYRLSIRQLRTLTSIRIMCSYGLDTNARLQLRLLYETSLLWARFRIDPECLDEYSSCTSPKKANEFWHKYLSKQKTERYLKKNLAEKGYIWLGNMEDLIEDLKEKLGLVAHPSSIADSIETLTDWNEAKGIAISKPSEFSYPTLKYSILITAMPFAIFPDPPYNFEVTSLRNGKTSWDPIPHPVSSWEEYNQLLRNMFPALFLIAIRFFEEFDKHN